MTVFWQMESEIRKIPPWMPDYEAGKHREDDEGIEDV
jgi:hypothetical protein